MRKTRKSKPHDLISWTFLGLFANRRRRLDSLRFFYDRLNPSDLIVWDDYGHEACPGAKKHSILISF